jgi:putative peptide zinc metalloprotease protein
MSDAAYAAGPRDEIGAPLYAFRAGVTKVKRHRVTILVAPGDGRAVRISRPAEALVPLLADGAERAALEAALAARFPGSPRVTRKLDQFLAQLRDAGMLTLSSDPAAVRKVTRPVARIDLFDMDPPARAVAGVIGAVPAWLGWGLLALVTLAALAGVWLVATGPLLPHPSAFVTEFHVAGILIFVGLVVPLHELSHAVATRLAGAEVGRAGIMAHGFLPGPFVETSGLYRVQSRWRRFCIPAAGPLVDLLAVGAGAWMVVLAADAEGPLAHAGQTLGMIALLCFIFDTNPLMPSDGSHMIEALLEDEMARKSALRLRGSPLSDRKDVAIYRICASTHLQGFGLLAWLWWF